MKYAGLTSQLAAGEETTSQDSSDTSSTLSRDEEIRRDSTPTPDVILTYSTPRNVGVFGLDMSPLFLKKIVGRFASISDH